MTREEWLKWRKGGVGSSDSPIIAGVSKFKTALELYEEKINPEIKEESNYITDLGNEIEPQIRNWFELNEDKSFPPALLEMDEHPWMRASLDGLNKESKIMLEIKLVGKDDFALIQAGTCPPQYLPQAQKGLLVSGADVCAIVGYLFQKGDNRVIENSRIACMEVYPDEKYHKEMFERERKFWFENVLKRIPPGHSDDDFKNLPGVTKWAKQWKVAKEKVKIFEAHLKEAETYLKEAATAANHKRLMANGIRLLRVDKAGSVDYASIPELKEINLQFTQLEDMRIAIIAKLEAEKNLDQYCGAGSSYWKLDLPKPKKEKDDVKTNGKAAKPTKKTS